MQGIGQQGAAGGGTAAQQLGSAELVRLTGVTAASRFNCALRRIPASASWAIAAIIRKASAPNRLGRTKRLTSIEFSPNNVLKDSKGSHLDGRRSVPRPKDGISPLSFKAPGTVPDLA